MIVRLADKKHTLYFLTIKKLRKLSFVSLMNLNFLMVQENNFIF
jgi:hypothetical protein